MKISYAITVCNEFEEIQRLVNFLLKNKRPEDEIIVLYDINNGHEGTTLGSLKSPQTYSKMEMGSR